MATISTMAMLKPTSMSLVSPTGHPTKAGAIRSVSFQLPVLKNLPKGVVSASSPMAATAVAGAMFSALSHTDAAFAVQQIADLAEGGDNRGLALLLPIVPAVAWVLFNILQPALNQLNRMRTEKGFVVGLGLGGGLATAGFLSTPSASASEEIVWIADAAASGDSRGLLLLFVVAPAIGWVLYNILQPALNQLNRMKSS